MSEPVRKLPDANDRTVMDFENFDAKNFIFSIFFKLSQTVSSDFKMVPKCFATLRRTPKASGHMPGSFEKKNSNRIFDLQKLIFLRWLLYPLKIHMKEVKYLPYQTHRKLFSYHMYNCFKFQPKRNFMLFFHDFSHFKLQSAPTQDKFLDFLKINFHTQNV